MLACAFLATATGCGSFSPANTSIALPRNAVAVTMLGADRVAVLAGDAAAKAAYVIDRHSGSVVTSFGVTKEATGIVAVSDAGPLVLSIGSENAGQSVGAVERWTTDGQKTGVLPLPGAALSLTRSAHGKAYAFIASGEAATAVPVDLTKFATGKPIPLDAGTKNLDACPLGAKTFLIYNDKQGHVIVREPSGTTVAKSTTVAQNPVCLVSRNRIVGLSYTFSSAGVIVLTLPNLLQEAELPASSTVVALHDLDDTSFVALNSTPDASSLETFSDATFESAPVVK